MKQIPERKTPMSIEEVSAENLARLIHHYHQALDRDFSGTSNESPRIWGDLSDRQKQHAVAAARLALLEIAATHEEAADRRRYFAKTGEAQVGCCSLLGGGRL